MKIALLQSNYIPWKGYFDMIDEVDHFVFYDEVQYTKNDWRNRNKIKDAHGNTQWITIPVRVEGLSQKVNETQVASELWRKKHLKTLKACYGRAGAFKELMPLIEKWYTEIESDMLSDINRHLILEVCRYLDIDTPITESTDYALQGDKQERILDLCDKLNADIYLSGPSARTYIDVPRFQKQGIEVEWMDYEGYPEYSQAGTHFEHGLSILDLMFHEGGNSRNFIKRSAQQ
ncbi:MAG: WbqC family protein [Flavobacteriales bacterium]|nr:WbqC family protein [Flavobacteriales bacterium]